MTRRKNKLTAICDEVFPEFTMVFKDPNGRTALGYRLQFPTPQAIAQADEAALLALRQGAFPSKPHLAELQALAAQSIGTKDPGRLRGLLLEQAQLITEL